MSLTMTGKIILILEAEKGTSKAGKEWIKQGFVIDNGSQYNPEVCFSLFGDDKTKLLNDLVEGQQVEVSFNISSREFNGKYYHNLDAWKIKAVDALENEPVPAESFGSEEDDLPF